MSSLESIAGAVVGAVAQQAVREVVELLDGDSGDEATALELAELAREVALAPASERAKLLRKAVLMLASERIAEASMDAALKAHKKLT
jgi:hypothetical protein